MELKLNEDFSHPSVNVLRKRKGLTRHAPVVLLDQNEKYVFANFQIPNLSPVLLTNYNSHVEN